MHGVSLLISWVQCKTSLSILWNVVDCEVLQDDIAELLQAVAAMEGESIDLHIYIFHQSWAPGAMKR
jgi:hypothetical protein